VCVELYDDYKQRIASINDRYLNKKES